jgi:nitrogen fixation NifU-like protein
MLADREVLDALGDLYRDLILDHCTRPRNFREMPDASRYADGHNRLCGDQLRLFVKIENGVLKELAFRGKGCCISKASASIMTQALRGKTVEDARRLFEEFHGIITGPPDEEPDVSAMGKMAAFGGVRRFPVRVKCATLAWHTLQAALKDDHTPVSTE